MNGDEREFLCWRILQDANDLSQMAHTMKLDDALTGDERDWLERAAQQIEAVITHRSKAAA